MAREWGLSRVLLWGPSLDRGGQKPRKCPPLGQPQGTHWDTPSHTLSAEPTGITLSLPLSPQESVSSQDNPTSRALMTGTSPSAGSASTCLAQDCQDHSFSVVIETVQVSPPGSPGVPTGMRDKVTPCVLLFSGPPSKEEDRQKRQAALRIRVP